MSESKFTQIHRANQECETIGEWLSLWWRVFTGMLICIPLLYLVGFICGILMLRNPIAASKELVNHMF